MTTRTLARALVGELLESRDAPLLRSSAALTVNTGLNAIIGFVYWVTAARLYPDVAVGSGAAAISALQLGAGFGWTGLQFTLMRYLPRAGNRARRLVITSYLGGLLVALPTGIAILAGTWLSGQQIVSSDLPNAALFLLGVAIWVVFSLEDAALIGMSRSAWVPVENAAYGLLKLAVLVLLASTASELGLLVSWVAGAVCLAALVNLFLFLRVLRGRERDPADLPSVGKLLGFSVGHHVTALVGALPDWLVPLLVVSLVSPQANAYYYAAWTVAYSLRLAFVNVANAMIVEGGRGERSLSQLVRLALVLEIGALTPAVAISMVAAHPILGLFGPSYGAGAGVLRLFAVGLLPFSLLTLFVAVERVKERVWTALAATLTATVVTIAVDVVLLPRLGIEGAGLGWAIGQSAGLLAAGVIAGATSGLRSSRARLTSLLVSNHPPHRTARGGAPQQAHGGRSEERGR